MGVNDIASDCVKNDAGVEIWYNLNGTTLIVNVILECAKFSSVFGEPFKVVCRQ